MSGVMTVWPANFRSIAMLLTESTLSSTTSSGAFLNLVSCFHQR